MVCVEFFAQIGVHYSPACPKQKSKVIIAQLDKLIRGSISGKVVENIIVLLNLKNILWAHKEY
jgi:hypothetical protein